MIQCFNLWDIIGSPGNFKAPHLLEINEVYSLISVANSEEVKPVLSNRSTKKFLCHQIKEVVSNT